MDTRDPGKGFVGRREKPPAPDDGGNDKCLLLKCGARAWLPS